MASGGARARSGPAPDPNALRRDRDKGGDAWTTLPSAGREGDPPPFPLSDPSQRELTLWEGEWRRPQAVMWEAAGQAIEVALYVRALVAAESPKATAAERTLVLRQQEYLGLSVPGLARNKWRIGDVEQSAPRKTAGRSRAKDRLKVVQGGGA